MRSSGTSRNCQLCIDGVAKGKHDCSNFQVANKQNKFQSSNICYGCETNKTHCSGVYIGCKCGCKPSLQIANTKLEDVIPQKGKPPKKINDLPVSRAKKELQISNNISKPVKIIKEETEKIEQSLRISNTERKKAFHRPTQKTLRISNIDHKETICLGELTCEVKLSYYCETHETNHFIDLDKGDEN